MSSDINARALFASARREACVKLFDDLQGRFHRGNPLVSTASLNRHRCPALSTASVRERDVKFDRAPFQGMEGSPLRSNFVRDHYAWHAAFGIGGHR